VLAKHGLYPWRLSIYQAEFSDNVIFHRTEVLNRVYEALLRDHLHLGRPDMLKVVFDRQIRRNTPGTFKTRLLRQGVGYLGTVAYHAIGCFLKAQAVALATALDRSTFERLVTPSIAGGQQVAGLRFGTSQVMRLLAALGCAGLTFKAFSHADLRATLVDGFGAEAPEVTPARLSYQVTKLRGKGLLRKVAGHNRYTLTNQGYRTALYLTNLHQRLLTPTLDGLDAAVRPALLASPRPLDCALTELNTHFDHLAELSGLKVAA
jgi:hypothetical protein